MSRFIPPYADVGKGITPSSGAKYFFFESNTSTPKNTYADEALTTPNTNPVISDSNGLFPDIWLEDGQYKVRLTDKNDIQKNPDADPVESLSSSASNVGIIDTVEALRLKEPTTDGQQISLLGHTSSGIGGGEFYFDATDTTSSDNNGTIIVTSGGSRWKRSEIGFVNPEMFGALGDGIANDTDALNAALSLGIETRGIKSSSYLSDGFTTTTGFSLDGRGCEIVQNSDASMLHYNATMSNIISVTSITGSDVDLSGGTSSDTNVSVLNVSNSAGYATNDVVKVVSEDLLFGNNPADQSREGEWSTVASVTATTITLRSRITAKVSTGVRVGKLGTNKVIMKNFSVTPSGNITSAWNDSIIIIDAAFEPAIENVSISGTSGTAIALNGCYSPSTKNVTGKDLRTSVADNAFGYLVRESACIDGRHISLEGVNVRHVYTCSPGFITGGNGTLHKYGSNYSATVSNGSGTNPQAAAFDTHADGVGVTFLGCSAFMPFSGPSGGKQGYQLRGRGNKTVGCTAYGGTGFRTFTDFPVEGNCESNHHIDGTYYYNETDTDDARGFQLVGSSTYRPPGCTFINATAYGKDILRPLFESFDADMTIIGTSGILKHLAAGRIYEANAGATMLADGCHLDLSETTATNMRIARLVDDTARIVLKNFDIKTPASGYFLADLVSTDSNFRCMNMNFTTEPSGGTGLTAVGAGATAFTDYVVDDATTFSRSLSGAVLVNAGATFALSIDSRFSDEIILPLVVSAVGGDIGSIDDGAFIGQALVIRSKTSSTQSVVITDSPGVNNLGLGSDRTLQIGDALRLNWDGFDWVIA